MLSVTLQPVELHLVYLLVMNLAPLEKETIRLPTPAIIMDSSKNPIFIQSMLSLDPGDPIFIKHWGVATLLRDEEIKWWWWCKTAGIAKLIFGGSSAEHTRTLQKHRSWRSGAATPDYCWTYSETKTKSETNAFFKFGLYC